MARDVKYLVWEDRYEQFRGVPFKECLLDMPPADISLIDSIHIGEAASTSRRSILEVPAQRQRACARWKLIATDLGIEEPKDMRLSSAIVCAEAIWLDTLVSLEEEGKWDEKTPSPLLFHLALENAVNEACRKKPLNQADWAKLLAAGVEAGVIEKLDAWTSGVGLEYILG